MLSLLSVVFLSGCSSSHSCFIFVSFKRAETLGAAKCLLECYQLFFVQMSKQFPMVIQTNVARSYTHTIIAETHGYGHSHRNCIIYELGSESCYNYLGHEGN